MTRVKWFGKVREGNEGVMNLGETPERMKEFSVGARLRARKSERKPSSEMRRVVGAKLCVPFDSVFAIDVLDMPAFVCDEALYAP